MKTTVDVAGCFWNMTSNGAWGLKWEKSILSEWEKMNENTKTERPTYLVPRAFSLREKWKALETRLEKGSKFSVKLWKQGGGLNNTPCKLFIVEICTGRPYPGPEVISLIPSESRSLIFLFKLQVHCCFRRFFVSALTFIIAAISLHSKF